MAETAKSDPEQYTKPALRDRIKKKVVAEDKGGNPGQWSARKAQLVTHEYEKQGGGYKKARVEGQKSLKKWGEEKWTTSDGAPAKRAGGTTRYLPKKAWEKLSGEEKAATNSKKKEGSRKGKQFVANTPAAAEARKGSAPAKKAPVKKTAAKKTAVKKAATKRAAKKSGT